MYRLLIIAAGLCASTFASGALAQGAPPQGAPLPPPGAPADVAPAGAITWEVKNRFRLFRHETDFQRHVAAHRGDGILGAERRLASGSGGRGWARLMLNGLCVDTAGTVARTCERDGVKEPYLVPSDHRIGVALTGAAADATCAWTFEQVDRQTQNATKPCRDEVQVRIAYGAPAFATVDVQRADGTAHARQRGNPRPRSVDRRPRRFDRVRRRQSRPADRARRFRLLFPPRSQRRRQRILPAEPLRLQRQPRLRDGDGAPRPASPPAPGSASAPAG